MNTLASNSFINDAPLDKQNDQDYFQLLIKLTLFSLVALSGYLVFISPDHLSPLRIFLGLAILWCGLTPTLLYLNNESRPPFPFLPMFGIFYAIWFGFSIFNEDLVFFGGQSQLRIAALFIILLGMNILFFSFYLSKKTLWKHVKPISLPKKFPLLNLRLLLWCLLLVNLASIVSKTVGSIPSLTQVFRPVGDIAFGLFFILWCRGKLPKWESFVIFVILFPLKIIVLLTSGTLSKPFFFALFLLIVYWYEKKRVPFFLLICFFSAFFFINPVKGELRQLTWFGNNFKNYSVFDKTVLIAELLYNHHFNKGVFEPKFQSTKTNLKRLNHISEFSHVVNLTPKFIPYWKGETYKGAFSKIIPRIIWPDKPIYSTGNHFGHIYGFIAHDDLVTAINLQWTIEMYGNFGIPGVIIGMALVGLLMAYGEQKLNHPDMTFLEFIVGLSILLPLAQPESGFLEMVGVVLQKTIFLYLVFYFGLKRWKNK